MQHYVGAFWHGIKAGAASHDRAGAPAPQTYGFTTSSAQGLYWFGFEIANVVVHGARS